VDHSKRISAVVSSKGIVWLDNLQRAGVQPPLRILTGTIRASTICCIAELATYFLEQSFPFPSRAVTFDNFNGATIGMAFRGVIPYADSYICVEGANRCGAGCLQCVMDSSSKIIGVVID
jgi:hypothetical protein